MKKQSKYLQIMTAALRELVMIKDFLRGSGGSDAHLGSGGGIIFHPNIAKKGQCGIV